MPGEVTYPPGHRPGMRVPRGGSSCATCRYLSKDREHCSNEHFRRWHGSDKLPAPADEYCSDWYEMRGGKSMRRYEGKALG
jgi:hypothetical protein